MKSGKWTAGFAVTMTTAVLLAACGGGSEDGTNTQAAAGWSAPVTLSVLDGDADAPSLAVDGHGNAAVAWTQYDDALPAPAYTLRLDYWKDGSGWLGEAGNVAAPWRRPQLLMTASGNNRLSWPGLSGPTLPCTRFQVPSPASLPVAPDAAWTCINESSTASGMVAIPYDVAGLADNLTLIAYVAGGDVKALYGATPGSYGGTTLTLSASAGTTGTPQLARLAGGDVLVAWCESGLLTSRRFNGSNWTAATQASGCVDKNLRLAVSADGTQLVAAGQKTYKGELHVWRYSTVVNAWSDTGDASLPYPHDSTYPPAVAVDNAGHILLAWVDYDSDSNRRSLRASVGTRSYIIGVLTPIDGWSEPVQLDDEARGDVAGPQLALDSAGNAWAVWTQYGGHWDVLARHFEASTFTLGGLQLLENDTGDAYGAQVAVDSNDKAVVAWGYVSGISGDSHSGIRAVRHQ